MHREIDLTVDMHELQNVLFDIKRRYYFDWDMDWDARDRFRDLTRILLYELLSKKCAFEISTEDFFQRAVDELIILATDPTIEVWVNRSIEKHGYWDVSTKASTIERMCFVDFFDFDFGATTLSYYMTQIVACSAKPEIEGRFALIPLESAKMVFSLK